MSTRDFQAKPWAIRGNQYGSFGVGDILDVPRVSLYRISAATLTTNVAFQVIWEVAEYNSDGMWDSAAPTRITAHTAGVYAFTAWGNIDANATPYRQIRFRKNGTGQIAGVIESNPGGTVITSLVTGAHIPLNAGDYVEVEVIQTSGVGLNFSVSNATDRENGFQACLISTI